MMQSVVVMGILSWVWVQQKCWIMLAPPPESTNHMQMVVACLCRAAWMSLKKNRDISMWTLSRTVWMFQWLRSRSSSTWTALYGSQEGLSVVQALAFTWLQFMMARLAYINTIMSTWTFWFQSEQDHCTLECRTEWLSKKFLLVAIPHITIG